MAHPELLGADIAGSSEDVLGVGDGSGSSESVDARGFDCLRQRQQSTAARASK